jgi:hypothetical protein
LRPAVLGAGEETNFLDELQQFRAFLGGNRFAEQRPEMPNVCAHVCVDVFGSDEGFGACRIEYRRNSPGFCGHTASSQQQRVGNGTSITE